MKKSHTNLSNVMFYYRIIINDCKKKLKFKHTSSKVIKDWVQYLQEEIKFPENLVIPRDNFWKVFGYQ